MHKFLQVFRGGAYLINYPFSVPELVSKSISHSLKVPSAMIHITFKRHYIRKHKMHTGTDVHNIDNEINFNIGSNNTSYRMRPSSSVPRGLNKEDIISSLGD